MKEDSYQKIFSYAKEVQVPTTLQETILKRINRESQKRVRVRLGFFLSSAIASFTSLFFVSVALFKSLVQSGVYDYGSLVFSDASILLTYWKEFTLSFVEAVPVFGFIAFLSIGAVFLWTGAKALRDIRPVLITH